ncbi:ABC transporter ATP-binding protein [Microvirga roseola]|uniref:ABC transporter ATP-binding protein n=1 Tax=Microvirga roseola TaxID=2883126 RepID=UPI001E37D466|nr:ABC transporter ATP-binding protein [Microvirga roseola]
MSQRLLTVEELTIALPSAGDRVNAVENVSFHLHPGEILCIVGESGSGKSMTASAIMGLLPDTGVTVRSGRIQFRGEDLLQMSDERFRAIRGSRIGMIFQEPMTALNPVMRIGDQIEEVLEAHNVPKANRPERVLSLLKAVGLPEPEVLARRYPFRLSGGQRQRVVIAMALALKPDILIADEPTTALDVTTQAQILKLIRDIQRAQGMGVIFITHDFGVVADIADRVAVMQHGRIVEIGPVRDVLDRPSNAYTQSLIGAVPQFRDRPLALSAGAEPVVRVRGLSKTYVTQGGLFTPIKEFKALDNVSFEIHRGETLGLVGESGSGKSTAGRCLVRLIDPNGGAIEYKNTDLAKLSRPQLRPFRSKIQIIFQDPFASLNPRHTVGQSIMAGPLAHGIDARTARERMTRLLIRVGLDASAADRYPHEFSGGQRQRIGIARALAVEPDLLVADEAVSALDVSVQAQVLELLRDIREEFQLAMLFITHDLRVASQLCHRVLVLHNGRVVESGETTSVFRSPRDSYTRSLIDAVPGQEWLRSSGGDPTVRTFA